MRRRALVLSLAAALPATAFCDSGPFVNVTPEIRTSYLSLGKLADGGEWDGGGVSSVTFRLETGWRLDAHFTVFGFAEQYEVVGEEARDTNDTFYNYESAHNDWTLGGVGARIRF